jgi:hypothetical protein
MNEFFEKIFSFYAKYGSKKELIEELYLKAIIDSYQRIKQISGIGKMSENEIRNKFIEDFKFYNEKLVQYISNKTVTKNEIYKSDMEFITAIPENKFVVECKILNAAQQRYLQGKNDKNGVYHPDGIERYVELVYAKDDDFAGMMSFIVKGNPEKIVERLKSRVKKFYPSENAENLINEKCVGWELSFQSKHLRKDETVIHLYHLFFDFTDE